MVLFYEDEKRLKPSPTKLRRRIRLAVRVFAVITVLFGISLVFMSNLSGSGDNLRTGVQDYLGGVTGMKVEIGGLERITFFPEASAAMSDMVFLRQGEGTPAARIGTFNFVMGFWDVFFRRGRIRALDATDIHFDAGVITAHPLDVVRIGIDISNEDENKARVSAIGLYDGQPFQMSMEMVAHDIGGRFDFRRPKEGAFKVDFPFMKMDGTVSHPRGGGLDFNLAGITAPAEISKGHVTLRRGQDSIVLSAGFTSAAGVPAAAAALEKIYCALKPPGRALLPQIRAVDVLIDGQRHDLSGACDSAATVTPAAVMPESTPEKK